MEYKEAKNYNYISSTDLVILFESTQLHLSTNNLLFISASCLRLYKFFVENCKLKRNEGKDFALYLV